VSRLPFSLKVLLENLLRFEDGRTVTKEDIEAVKAWLKTRTSDREIAYRPARVLMQDFTGVPAVVDLAAMRDAVKNLGSDPKKINPLVPVDLVIDHSVMVDKFGTATAFKENTEIEYQRNRERYEFLRWGSKAFNNFRVVPPGTGDLPPGEPRTISPTTVWTKTEGKEEIAYSRHLRRHGQPHHDGERPRRARLGRGRHRGGSGHARPAGLHAHPGSDRLQADRQAQ